ncbi:MAG: hybrid sensor histidine kinase/response regulator [Leptolyngbyaceae cyanobacterium MO_188.B28]|nr:hybrid sensor histidine kinase/response regulator [Leptolyngbyaceae cyanobacterium MO_188.B28]
MTPDPTIREQGYQFFLQEAPELLQTLEQGLLTLGEDSSINKVNDLMRATHTLKGAASSIGLETITSVAHSLEDIFRALCRPDVEIDPEVEALLFEGFECLRQPLEAEIRGGGYVDHADVLDRTATVFAQLQDKLGDCFDQDAHLPTSAELGFDVTQSMFEVGVNQRLEQLETVISNGQQAEIFSQLQTQAEVFGGLAESLDLPGFGAISQVTLTALKNHPDQVIAIAQQALDDFRAGQAAVLSGDRSQGGEPSAALQSLAEQPSIPPTDAHQPDSLNVFGEPAPSSLNVFGEPTPSSLNVFGEPTDNNVENSDATATIESSPKGIGKLFQWFRGAVHPQAKGAASEPSISEPGDSDPTILALTPVDEQRDASHSPVVKHHESEADDPPLSPFGEPLRGESDNSLIENIWGRQVEDDSPTQEGLGALTVANQPTAVNQPPLHPIFPSTSSYSEPAHPTTPVNRSTRTPTPFSQNSSASTSPQVRVNVEHLDQLNYSVGELLTNQNRQSFQIEQLRQAVQTLYARLNQHQRMLNQLQDWSDLQSWEWRVGNEESGIRGGAGKNPASEEMQPDLEWSNLEIGGDFQSAVSNLDSANNGERRPFINEFDVLELDRYSQPQLIIQSLLDDTVQLTEAADGIDLFTRQSNQTLEKQHRLLLNTRDALIEARMLPLGSIFERLPPVLQQLETLHSKPARIELHGTDVLVDKVVAEKLYDPLLHLVRNAFDHGIEPVDVRQQRGKEPTGKLKISAHHHGKYLVIEVWDDGGGLNYERIRQQAVDRLGFSPEEVLGLDLAQLAELMFEPGFSTVSKVSNLSGRGIGLDVVRSQLQALKGSVTVLSHPHQGTTFTLKIPLSLTIAKLLLCRSGGKVYALLPDAIEQILIPQPDQIQDREVGKILRWGAGDDQKLVPIYPLSTVLDYGPPGFLSLSLQPDYPLTMREPGMQVIVVNYQDTLLGLEVEQLIGEQELIIRPLGNLVGAPSYVYGASILADGQLALVLDAATLMQRVFERQAKESLEHGLVRAMPSDLAYEPPSVTALPGPDNEKLRQQILVVEDSLTTRQTLALTLQQAGYQVFQAKDGQDAIAQLERHSNINMVICDIEMPRMNGFEFLRHCQKDPDLANIPVAMLSSRSGQKHRQLAEQLGATAYMSKPYLEHKLLNMVAEVLGVEMLNSV